MGDKSHLGFGDFSLENSLMHSAVAAPPKADFSGWATKANLKCSDGRTILPDAFAHQDKAKVPLVWAHGHDEPSNVLGHAVLESKDGSVYAYGYFNDTDSAQNAKTLVEHGDISYLSIFANQLVEKAKQVSHGIIRELSLVLAGANPGAMIDNIELQHSDGDMVTLEDEAVIYTGEKLSHGDGSAKKDDDKADEDGPSVQDVYDEMSPEQKEVVHYMVGAAIDSNATTDDPDKTAAHSATGPDDKETRTMSRNVFESQQPGGVSGKEKQRLTLSHEDAQGIMADAVRTGSLKEAVQKYALQHGIDNIDLLFPDARTVTDQPDLDSRRMAWVVSVINGTRHSPFSRIKSLVADITHDEARAKGYIKGSFKKEEWVSLAKRITTPTTVYKKQKLDRDDIVDIVDLDVVAWLKAEMRLMLDEEIARAILIGDGREVDDEDKIRDPAGANDGAGIRSIVNDHDLYAPKIDLVVPDDASGNNTIIDAIVSNMSLYKGTGQPTFYTTQAFLTKLLLTRDGMNRRMYRTASDLASELGVSNIVAVEVMEDEVDLVGVIVNLSDYTCGADQGGDVTMFDDFDIDYNQYKYLIEGRMSGALTKIRSALVLRKVASGATLKEPVEPTFDPATGEITVPTTVGVSYRDEDGNVVSGSTVTVPAGEQQTITAVPTAGNYFATSADSSWTFTHRGAPTGRDATAPGA
jgi:hypothetical protein